MQASKIIRLMHVSLKNKFLKVLICPDKFKFSMTAQQVADIIASNLPANFKSKTILLADGGEGSLNTIASKLQGKMIKCNVHNPIFKKIQAQYFCTDQREAYIQMAKASGLALIKEQQRNPLFTTTLGTGQLILDSLKRGNKKINLLIGGSATNDGGIGCAQALGYSFFGRNSQKLLPIGESLNKIVTIKKPNDDFMCLLKGVQIKVYTDVKNPLLGKNGASHVYAGQKGANQFQIMELDEGLGNLNNIFKSVYHVDVDKIEGSGAAGGLGGGCVVFLGSKLLRGIDLIFQLTNFEKQLSQADLVITGEGKLDSQTMQGKVVKGVIERSLQLKKPVLVFCAIAEPIFNSLDVTASVQIIELLNGSQKLQIEPFLTKERLKERLWEYFDETKA